MRPPLEGSFVTCSEHEAEAWKAWLVARVSQLQVARGGLSLWLCYALAVGTQDGVGLKDPPFLTWVLSALLRRQKQGLGQKRGRRGGGALCLLSPPIQAESQGGPSLLVLPVPLSERSG